MRTRNWPLVLGTALTVLFAVLALAGPQFAPHDPLQTNLYLRMPNGVRMVPVAPGVVPSYPLGTDEAGRDVLSRILYGIRPTLLICVIVALARLAVGVLIGVVGGWFRGVPARVVDVLGSIGVGLPALVLAIGLITVLGLERGVLTFVIALTVVGWIEVANLIKAQTLSVAQAPYVESARALGVGPWGIMRRHLVPQLRPLVPVLLAFELSAALLLVTELGFLGIYLGGGMAYEADVGGNYRKGPIALTSEYPELGQQISRFWTKFYRTPWEFLVVATVIFAQIVAFNLVGEGLRRRLDVTQPRQRRWLRMPDAVLDRVPVFGWQWVPVGALVAALAVGGWWSVRPHLASAPNQLQAGARDVPRGASAAPSTPTFSDTPLSAAQLRIVNVDALLAQPGLLPKHMTVGQAFDRVPDQFRKVPPAVQTRNFTLYEFGLNAGNIVVLLYPSTEERDQAMYAMAAVYTPLSDTGIGGLTTFSASALNRQCGALVQVEIASRTNGRLQEDATALAQTVATQLTPLVCQPQQGSQGQNR